MIRPLYAVKLARTKLYSKRAILLASVVVASLLFAALIAIIIVFAGAEKSANEFIKKAGNDRYLVRVTPYVPEGATDITLYPSLKEIREIRAFEKQYYQEQKEKYKTLGLVYDESSETPALVPRAYYPETLPEEERFQVDHTSPVIVAMTKQKTEAYLKTATNKLADLKRVGSDYGASGYYSVGQPSRLSGLPNLRLIQDGKEDFGVSERKGGSTPQGMYVNSAYNGMYQFTDQHLLSRYLLTTDTSHLKGIPVVISAQEAAALFGKKVGISDEPENASEKRAWLKNIQEKLKGATYQSCYRNSVEQAMLDKIQRDYADMKNNEDDNKYQKPSLIYGYPTEVCGDIVTKEDTRTQAEKSANTKTEETQKKLGTYIAPNHKLLTFQIVGIKYSVAYADHTENIESYIKNLLVAQDNAMAIDIPLQMYETLPDDLKITNIQEDYSFASKESIEYGTPRALEFKTAAAARDFLGHETCLESETSCDKQYLATPYGSNYLILDEIGALFSRIVAVAFPVALGLATIIIWFTISRIMVENRKETAVYRAMGAKRFDIVTIYFVYVLIVALRILIVSMILGVMAAFAIDRFYGSFLTDTAVTLFGIIDDAPRVSLLSLESPLLGVIIGLIFVVSIIASVQPLVRNTMRPPIQDMRDE